MQRKFDEFLKELDNHQYRIAEITQQGDHLIEEGHPNREVIYNKRNEVINMWHELGTLTATRFVFFVNIFF